MARIRFSTSLVFAAVAAPMALGGCAMTSTYGTGEAPEMALFREMTGGLMSNEEKKPIDYQPRAPLVMPASAEQLPPPVETASVADPDWPVDRNERLASLAVGDGDPTQEDYRRLKPMTGLLQSGTRKPRRPNSDLAADREEYFKFIQQGKEKRGQFTKALADSKGYTRRNERRYLIDPPLELGEPAKSAPEEFDDVGKNLPFWKRIFVGAE